MVCDEYCVGCAFHGPAHNDCRYLLVMNVRRGCAAGALCDKKMSKKELKEMGVPKNWDKEGGKRMWAEGKGDAEIAKAFGVAQGTISYFRRKHWEPSVVPEASAAECVDPSTPLRDPQDDSGETDPSTPPRSAQDDSRETDPLVPLRDPQDNREDEESVLVLAMEQATANRSGMDAVMTAQLMTFAFTWKELEDLQQAKACLDYLIGRHEHG